MKIKTIFFTILALAATHSVTFAQETDPEAGNIPAEQVADSAKEPAAQAQAVDPQNTTHNETFGIRIAAPVTDQVAWTAAKKVEKPSIVSYNDESTGSRIDILANKVVRPQYAKALFASVAEQLKQAEFTVVGEAKEVTYQKIKGTLNSYDYMESEVMLRTMTFSFNAGNNAYMVVGYVPRSESERMAEVFTQFIQNLALDQVEAKVATDTADADAKN